MTDTILRLRDVSAVVGLKRSSIYNLVAEGRFPAPVRLGRAAVGWRQSDVQDWISKLRPARAPADGRAHSHNK